MKISKNSWHYRFNNFTQAKFEYRAENGLFTTCSYIRTTIRSMIQFIWVSAVLLLLGGVLVTFIGSGIYLPIALVFGFTVPSSIALFAGCIYFVLLVSTGQFVYHRFIEEKLYERRERKLGLLRQAAADKKAGICTIVEFE